ncbi:MAG TPA: tetratricopeptide repeat protein [Candidatus Obscuribacterales bacterium]
MNQQHPPSSEQLLAHYLELARRQPDAPDVLFTLALLFQNRKDLEQAGNYYQQGLALRPDVWEAQLALAEIRVVQGRTPEAAERFRQALALNPDSQHAWFGLANLYVRQRAWPELDTCYAEILARFPELQQTPAIFLNTLPRSASIYLTTTLRLLLGREFLMVAEIDSASDAIYPQAARHFACGGVISQAHLPATAYNLDVLNSCFDKLVVHLRDPRQATLSLVYLFRSQQQAGNPGLRLVPPLPEGYAGWSLPVQIDWNLEHYYPVLIRWIADWLDVRDQGLFHGELLLTRYEDFRADAAGFYRQILGFYGIGLAGPDFAGITPAPGYLNFRKGDVEEWRTVFSPEQAERASRLLPERLNEIFA